MHDKPRNQAEPTDRDQPTQLSRAKNAILEAFASRRHSKAYWEGLIVTMAPFRDVQFLAGSPSVDASNGFMSLVWHFTGDAHREVGRPLEAAECYNVAVELRPSLALADVYMCLVLRHGYVFHYETALRSLAEGRKNQRAMPFRILLAAWCIGFLHSPKSLLTLWKNFAVRGRRRRELVRRIDNMRSASDSQTTGCTPSQRRTDGRRSVVEQEG